MIDLLCPLEVGQPVIHTITKLCGIVEAVEHYGTSNRQLLTVRLLNGKYMRAIAREEFRLHTAGPAERDAQTADVQARHKRYIQDEAILDTKLEGSISDKSILGELC